MESSQSRDLPPTPGKGWVEEYLQSVKASAKKNLFGEEKKIAKKSVKTKKQKMEEEFKQLFGDEPEITLRSRPMSAKYKAIFGLD